MTERQNKRCAIYTRKSHEDGLDKEFNSLEAQREVCEAAIRAKAHERWTILAEEYNDGGFSGGNIDRPGLERLLEDIRDGRIDIVVVYKIVRLTELAPDITAAILNGRQPSSLTLSQIRAVPLLWDEQRRAFGFTA